MLKSIVFALSIVILVGCAAQENRLTTAQAADAPFSIEGTWYWPGGGDAHGYPAYITVNSVDADGAVQGHITTEKPPLVRTHAPVETTYIFGVDQHPPIRAHWSGWRLEIEWIPNGTHYYLDRNEEGALTGMLYSLGTDRKMRPGVAKFTPK
jgi:hypothetical protein